MKDPMTLQMNTAGAQAGLDVIREFNEQSTHPMEVAEAFLFKLLSENADTEYGKKYHFSEIKSVKEYMEKVPVITYEAVDEYIERMKAGEKNILTCYPYNHFNTTSGTIGKAKSIPMTDPQTAVYMKYGSQYNLGIMETYLDPSWKEGRSFSPTEGAYTTLDNGMTVGCASSKMAEACTGGVEPFGSMLRSMFSSPPEAMLPDGETNTRYLHVRFAMMDKDLTGITAGFPVNLVHQMSYIRDNYEMLIDDIEKGNIDESITISDAKRVTLAPRLVPMPERAAELREIFKDGPNFPFMPEVWPNMQYIFCAYGDGMTVYNDTLTKYFHGGKIAQICAGITASEGLWSVPSGVNDPDSIIVPDGVYIEYLPVEAGDDFSQICTMDEVEIGKIYELIITNLCGLYRYRMSDAVKVTGFHGKLPKVQFMYRVNKTISLALEKTTETALLEAAKQTAKRLDFQLLDYEVYPDREAVPGKYIFLLETYDEKRFQISKEELSKVCFEELCKANPRVLAAHKAGNIGDLEAYFEQPETQLLYRDKMIYQGASAQQFKPVHVIGNEEQRKFFMIMREE